jgi:8-oxo-dGTP pyrophosphatase MutT (NUDIX family)
MSEYLKWIRNKVGTSPIFLNGAALIITNNQNQILLQKRFHDKNLWGVIGGSMDLGETFEETAKREAKEEINCEIKLEYLIGIYSKYHVVCPNGDRGQAITALFKAAIIKGTPETDNVETFDLQYFSESNLPPIDTHQLVFIKDYYKGLRGAWN